jgi:multiple sugar transport system permease protein
MLRLSWRFFYIAIVPAFLIFLGLVIYPLFKVISYSLTSFQLIKPNLSEFVWFEQFTTAVSDSRFQMAVGRSLYFAVISVIVTLILGYIIAALLKRTDLKGISFFRIVILIPMLMTPLVAGAAFRYLYDYDYGMINDILSRLGMEKIPFMSDPFWAIHSAIIADIWQWTPFAVIVLLAGMESMPKEPLEAADIDGAGYWRTLFQIYLPLLRPVIGIVVLMRFMDAFREFDKLYILTAGGPGSSSETLSIYVWKQAFQYFNTGYAAAAGVIMLLIVNFISMYYVRFSKTLQ